MTKTQTQTKIQLNETQDQNLFEALKNANKDMTGFKINKAIRAYMATGQFPNWVNVPENITSVLAITGNGNKGIKNKDTTTATSNFTIPPVIDFNLGAINGYDDVATLCKNGWNDAVMQKVKLGLTKFFKDTGVPMKAILALLPTTGAAANNNAIPANLKGQTTVAITSPEKLVKTLVGIYLNTKVGKTMVNVPGASIIVAQFAVNALIGQKVGNIKDAMNALTKVTNFFKEYPVITAIFSANNVLPEVTTTQDMMPPFMAKPTTARANVSH